MTIAEDLKQYYEQKEQNAYSLMEIAALINKVHIENGNFIINKVKVPRDVYQDAVNVILAGGEFSAVCNSIDNVLSEYFQHLDNMMKRSNQRTCKIIVYSYFPLF